MSDPIAVADPMRQALIRLTAQRKTIAATEAHVHRSEDYRHVTRAGRKRAMRNVEPVGLTLDMERLADALREGRSSCSSVGADGETCRAPTTGDGRYCDACAIVEVERERRAREDVARKKLRSGIHSTDLHRPGVAVDLPGFPSDLWSSVPLYVAREWQVRAGRGLWFYGGVGSGKTMIFGGMVERLLREGTVLCAASAGRLLGSLGRLRRSFVRDADEYDRAIRYLSRVPVLMLDDVLATAMRRDELDVLLEVLDARWSRGGLPIVCTSNVARTEAMAQHLGELAASDRVARDRVASRLVALTGTEIPCFFPGDRRSNCYNASMANVLWPDVAAWRDRLGMDPATVEDANREAGR